MPDWLSDLVPKYLSDTNCLLCPVCVAMKMAPSWVIREDPKVTTSYSYEFSARSINNAAYGLFAPGDTMKAWKTKQLARYGDIVPVLRCNKHSETLNVSYDGEVFESSWDWRGCSRRRWRAGTPRASSNGIVKWNRREMLTP